MSDGGATVVTAETIGALFQNEANRLEGWGVFLVRDPKGALRLEVQKVDEMAIFETDAGARAHLRRQVKAENTRHLAVAQEIYNLEPALYMGLFMSRQAKTERNAR